MSNATSNATSNSTSEVVSNATSYGTGDATSNVISGAVTNAASDVTSNSTSKALSNATSDGPGGTSNAPRVLAHADAARVGRRAAAARSAGREALREEGDVPLALSGAGTVRLAGFLSRLWILFQILGTAAVIARLLMGITRLRAIVRRARPAEPHWAALAERISHGLGLRRPVSIRIGAAGSVPVTCGILRPLVILPADAAEWDEERRTLVLTHELAHVHRYDVLTHIVGQLAVALFWYHPLAWLAATHMRQERERACDDLVLGAGARPSRYAGDLLELVQTLSGAAAPAAAALAMARRTEIEGRLLAILDRAVRRDPIGRRRIATTVAAASTVVFALASVHPMEAAVARPQPATIVLSPVEATFTLASLHRDSIQLIARHKATKDVLLADVAAEVATIASDATKRSVLLEIAQHYCSSDTLRRAFFTATNTISSDTERRRVLLGLLGRGSRDAATVTGILRSATMMSSDADKGLVLRTVAGLDPLTNADVRHEFFAATNTMTSNTDRAGVLLAVLGEARARSAGHPDGALTVARAAIGSTSKLSSTDDKVRVLRALVRGGWMTNESVQRDFKICLTTVSE